MSTKHDLKHSILTILKHNKDGSYATQANRRTQLIKFGMDLLDKGFYLRNIHQLKPKHIYRMVEDWKTNELGSGTMKNRMANIRWLCEKINKPGLIPANNDEMHIEKRQYITNKDKSITLDENKLEKIDDPDVKMSIQLQQAFGLRKEESIKIKIHEAVVGGMLKLQGPWCKNGRPRDVKIQYQEQWDMIVLCKKYIGDQNRALIPDDKTYFQQMKRADYEKKI